MSKARQKGTQYENHVRDEYLRRIWPDAERSPLRGVNDAGDFDLAGDWIVEAKKRNAWRLGDWIRTVQEKAERFGRDWVIVFAGDKRLKGLDRDYVVLEAATFFEILEAYADPRWG